VTPHGSPDPYRSPKSQAAGSAARPAQPLHPGRGPGGWTPCRHGPARRGRSRWRRSRTGSASTWSQRSTCSTRSPTGGYLEKHGRACTLSASKVLGALWRGCPLAWTDTRAEHSQTSGRGDGERW